MDLFRNAKQRDREPKVQDQHLAKGQSLVKRKVKQQINI